MRRSTIPGLLLLAIAASLAWPTFGAPPTVTAVCASVAVTDKKDSLRYLSRGNRCEGRYGAKVGTAPELVLGSLVSTAVPALIPKSTWRMSWSPSKETVSLQANSLKYLQFYRMDASAAPGVSFMDWPTDILLAVPIQTQNLGLLLSTRRQIGTRSEVVYLPAALAAAAPTDAEITARILSQQNLKEVTVTLSALKGGDLVVLRGPTALKYGYYPQHVAIRVPLGQLPKGALVRVEITGTTNSGRETPLAFWVQSGG